MTEQVQPTYPRRGLALLEVMIAVGILTFAVTAITSAIVAAGLMVSGGAALAADDYEPLTPDYSDYTSAKMGFAFPDRQSMNIQKVFRDNAVNRARELGWEVVETDAKWDVATQSQNLNQELSHLIILPEHALYVMDLV